MKKLLFILPLFALISCTKPTFENSAKGLTVEQSEELLSQHRDTVVVTKTHCELFVIDNDKIIERYVVTNNHSSKSIPALNLIFLFLCMILGGIAIGVSIFKT